MKLLTGSESPTFNIKTISGLSPLAHSSAVSAESRERKFLSLSKFLFLVMPLLFPTPSQAESWGDSQFERDRGLASDMNASKAKKQAAIDEAKQKKQQALQEEQARLQESKQVSISRSQSLAMAICRDTEEANTRRAGGITFRVNRKATHP